MMERGDQSPRNDEARVPPGQTLTRIFPVVGEKEPGRVIDPAAWRLTVRGLVRRPVEFTLGDILALSQEELRADIHCVTSWSRLGLTFSGIPLARLLGEGVEPLPEARFVRFLACSSRGHDTSLPLETALADSWLVHSCEGRPLTVEHGYPLRVVTPSRYFYKSLKWLREIEFLEEDRLGFWERTSAYHNHGDPWREERFSAHRFTSAAEAEAFRSRDGFDDLRAAGEPPVILRADFSGWKPRSTDLRRLQFKACRFEGADLRGADFSGGNLTLSRFEGADLRGARFVGTDLEGARFCGADLAGALLEDNDLSAAVFVRTPQGGERQELSGWDGLRVRRPRGLLESQAAYLRALGVLKEGGDGGC